MYIYIYIYIYIDLIKDIYQSERINRIYLCIGRILIIVRT